VGIYDGTFQVCLVRIQVIVKMVEDVARNALQKQTMSYLNVIVTYVLPMLEGVQSLSKMI
jgi:hypothetical protein